MRTLGICAVSRGTVWLRLDRVKTCIASLSTVAAMLGIGLAGALSQPAAAAVKYRVLHNFTTANNYGYSPSAVIINNDTGVVYGTAENGGENNGGTLFQLTPPEPPKNSWQIKLLHVFGVNPDGAGPTGTLLSDTDGSIYGVTVFGPPLVYKLSPPKPGKKQWTETWLHSYVCCRDSVSPYAGLIPEGMSPPGTITALYGVSSQGGKTTQQCSFGCGTI
jgi:hypothetical protein